MSGPSYTPPRRTPHPIHLCGGPLDGIDGFDETDFPDDPTVIEVSLVGRPGVHYYRRRAAGHYKHIGSDYEADSPTPPTEEAAP